VNVRDIASVDVVTVGIDDTVRAAAVRMRDARVGSVVVLDGRGDPAGIVTDRDLVVYVCDPDRDPDTTTVNDVMAREVVSVGPGASVFEAAAAMAEAGVRRVPVLADGDLVGIVTLDDLLPAFADGIADLAAVVEAESRR
jgi:signal-transduction protein with cAMP-binding, CBS, and nucleotidyltransferase domain